MTPCPPTKGPRRRTPAGLSRTTCPRTRWTRRRTPAGLSRTPAPKRRTAPSGGAGMSDPPLPRPGRSALEADFDHDPGRLVSAAVRPTGAWHRDRRGEHPSGTRAGGEPLQVVHEVLVHVPVGGQHEERATVITAEGAGEAGVFERYPIEHLPTVGHPQAAGLIFVPTGRPDGALGIHADPVRQHLSERPA